MLSAPLIEAADLMLATLRPRVFSDKAFLYELKYDGYRCLVRKTGASVDLISRAGNLLNPSFPDIVAAVTAVPGDFTFDAELTVDEANGRSSFEWLRRRAVTKLPMRVRAAVARHPARLYLFDALSVGGEDLRELPLVERKNYLRDAFGDTNTLIYATGIVGAGEWVFEQAKGLDLEGMVAKRMSSPYRSGRSPDWLKIKNPRYSRPAALGWGREEPTVQEAAP
jgi:bifunctional non-homologous end joining protein LigD